MREVPTEAYQPRQKARIATVKEPRCGDAPNVNGDGCGRMLARLISAPAHIDCPRCKRPNIWSVTKTPDAV